MLKKIFFSLSLVLFIISAAPVIANGHRNFDPDRLEKIKQHLDEMYVNSPPEQKAKIREVGAKWNALSRKEQRKVIIRLIKLREAHENLET